jgi:hypothetical protein
MKYAFCMDKRSPLETLVYYSKTKEILEHFWNALESCTYQRSLKVAYSIIPRTENDTTSDGAPLHLLSK